MAEDTGLLVRWKLLRAATRDGKLSRGDVACLGAVLDRINVDSGTAWPSLATIGIDAGVDRRTAARAIARLVEIGYLERESGNRTTSNRYAMGTACSGESVTTTSGELTPTPSGEPVTSGSGESVTGVVANLSLGVVAGLSPELAYLNLPIEPAKLNLSAPATALPSWLPAESWSIWKQHRGKKFTALAERLSLKRLEELRAAGHDPVKVIEMAIGSGWTSFNSRAETLAKGRVAGEIKRDSRTDTELDAANRAQMARFGMEIAP